MRRVEICDAQGAVLETVNIDDSSPHWENEVLERFNERGTATFDVETNTVPQDVLEADTKAREAAANEAKGKVKDRDRVSGAVSVRPVDSSGTYPSATPLAEAPRFDAETQEQLTHALRSQGVRHEKLAEESYEKAKEFQDKVDREANDAARGGSSEARGTQAEPRKVTAQPVPDKR